MEISAVIRAELFRKSDMPNLMKPKKRNLAALLPELTDDECLWVAFKLNLLDEYERSGKAALMLGEANKLLFRMKKVNIPKRPTRAKPAISLIEKLERYLNEKEEPSTTHT